MPHLGQFAHGQTHQIGNFAQQLPLQGAIGQQQPQWFGIAGQVGAAFRGVQVATFARRVNQKAA